MGSTVQYNRKTACQLECRTVLLLYMCMMLLRLLQIVAGRLCRCGFMQLKLPESRLGSTYCCNPCI